MVSKSFHYGPQIILTLYFIIITAYSHPSECPRNELCYIDQWCIMEGIVAVSVPRVYENPETGVQFHSVGCEWTQINIADPPNPNDLVAWIGDCDGTNTDLDLSDYCVELKYEILGEAAPSISGLLINVQNANVQQIPLGDFSPEYDPTQPIDAIWINMDEDCQLEVVWMNPIENQVITGADLFPCDLEASHVLSVTAINDFYRVYFNGIFVTDFDLLNDGPVIGPFGPFSSIPRSGSFGIQSYHVETTVPPPKQFEQLFYSGFNRNEGEYCDIYNINRNSACAENECNEDPLCKWECGKCVTDCICYGGGEPSRRRLPHQGPPGVCGAYCYGGTTKIQCPLTDTIFGFSDGGIYRDVRGNVQPQENGTVNVAKNSQQALKYGKQINNNTWKLMVEGISKDQKKGKKNSAHCLVASIFWVQIALFILIWIQ
eukprot:299342_1